MMHWPKIMDKGGEVKKKLEFNFILKGENGLFICVLCVFESVLSND